MNTLVLQLAILFLPGLIWERMHTNFSLKDKPEQFDVIRRAFMYGIFSYALEFSIYSVVGKRFELVKFDSDHIAMNYRISREVGYATLIAFLASILHIWADSRRFLARAMLFANVTRKFGPEDVWDFTFSRSDPSASFVHVRDFEKKIIYAGFVLRFSESEKLRELVLSRAIAYSFEGDELFSAPRVYISRGKDDIDIAFPIEPWGRDRSDEAEDGKRISSRFK